MVIVWEKQRFPHNVYAASFHGSSAHFQEVSQLSACIQLKRKMYQFMQLFQTSKILLVNSKESKCPDIENLCFLK